MTRTGCPIDVPLHDLIVSKWPTIRRALIDSVSRYGIFDEEGVFKHERFAVVVEGLVDRT